MAAAQGGDERAYQRLLQGCIPAITATARHQGVTETLIDDVIQDVLLTLHRARATYDPSYPFLPWLRAIARYRAIDLLRRRGRQGRQEVHAPAALENALAEEHDTDERLDWATRAAPLASAIRSLPQGQREAVERLALREQSLAEASADTGRSKVALKVNLHRAINTLRQRFGAKPGDGGNV